jgi:trehalose/maltose transport system substrate-binding protein
VESVGFPRCRERHTDRARWLAFLLLSIILNSCSNLQPAEEPKYVTALMGKQSYKLDTQLAQEFTDRTGIAVRLVPGSEAEGQRLAQEQALLRTESSGVDVFEIDTTWPAMVGAYLADVKDVVKDDLDDEVPEVVENATVQGRLIGAPFYVDYGLMYYRTDLLRKYGFSHPPHTWDELETQAARIQRGERSFGKHDFWGYVWQGANYESLACDALEWQVSQGGGQPVEEDHTINVNNPAAVRAFLRARRWIGNISPPGVVAYLEEDSRNFWQSGRAAFMRNWSYAYRLARQSPEVRNRFSVAPIPAGVDHGSSVLGGWYLGISRHSHHRSEAVAFVRFMVSKEAQRERAIEGAFLPTLRSLYEDPGVLRADPFLSAIQSVPNHVIRRATSVLGAKYTAASQIYAHGVHMILTGEADSSQEAAVMEQELIRLTGFGTRTRAAQSGPYGNHP